MLRNTTVDSAMPLSLVSRSWSAAMRPGSMPIGGSANGSGGVYRASSTLANVAGVKCSSLSGWSQGAMSLAIADRGGIRPLSAALIEQSFGGAMGETALNRDRDHQSAFVSKVTYGRSHDPAVRRRRGEG